MSVTGCPNMEGRCVMRLNILLRVILLSTLFLQVGCAALLPRAKVVSESPWGRYEEAKEAFDAITVGKTTTADLKGLGFDVASSPNLKILNYLDIASTVDAIPEEELDPGLRACMKARSDCRAYVFEPKRDYNKRIGNFWLDILGFKRKTHHTGWRFKALIVFVNDHVAYKLSSGEPKTDEMEDKTNPLGPFQTPADLIVGAF
jgi:hypothetical protein